MSESTPTQPTPEQPATSLSVAAQKAQYDSISIMVTVPPRQLMKKLFFALTVILWSGITLSLHNCFVNPVAATATMAASFMLAFVGGALFAIFLHDVALRRKGRAIIRQAKKSH